MTEKTFTTENGSFTETESCISEAVGSCLLNLKNTDAMLCELHEISTAALQGMYKAVRDSIAACYLASELPCTVMDVLVALSSFIAHEIVRRQIDEQ